MRKVLAIVVALVSIATLVGAGNFDIEIALMGYPTLGDNEAVTDFIGNAAAEFDIKWHVRDIVGDYIGVGLSGKTLGIQLELRGKDGKELDNIRFKGTHTIISQTDKSKSKAFSFTADFTAKQTRSKYVETLSRDEVLNPANGYYDKPQDTVLFKTTVNYTVNGKETKTLEYVGRIVAKAK